MIDGSWIVSPHILAEGDSQVYFFDGNIEYENKKQRLGDVQPHRIRYRSLVDKFNLLFKEFNVVK